MTLLSRSTIIAVCFILAITLAIALSLPRYKTLKELRQKIKVETEGLEYQEKYLSELRQASDKLKEHGESLKKINSALPPSPDLPALFNYFQKASSENGLVLQNVSPPSIGSSELIKEAAGRPGSEREDSLLPGRPSSERVDSLLPGRQIEFSLSLSGSYSSFKSFLATLQKSARLITLESVAFSSPEKTGLFNFNVDVKMHSY